MKYEVVGTITWEFKTEIRADHELEAKAMAYKVAQSGARPLSDGLEYVQILDITPVSAKLADIKNENS